ncbi:unnamed protein product [Cochlearia groenlandica]
MGQNQTLKPTSSSCQNDDAAQRSSLPTNDKSRAKEEDDDPYNAHARPVMKNRTMDKISAIPISNRFDILEDCANGCKS